MGQGASLIRNDIHTTHVYTTSQRNSNLTNRGSPTSPEMVCESCNASFNIFNRKVCVLYKMFTRNFCFLTKFQNRKWHLELDKTVGHAFLSFYFEQWKMFQTVGGVLRCTLVCKHRQLINSLKIMGNPIILWHWFIIN